jgi:phosphomannomutase/choline kinase
MMDNLPVKVVVLAAGSRSITADGMPVMLQELNGKKIIDYVMENIHKVVQQGDIFVVVGYQQQAIRDHLGLEYNYIVQEKPNGTGEAVLAIQSILKDFEGDLLIIYGDTPLFSPNSIRGLINRHRKRRANFTILTAIVDRPYPYGRIIRNNAGCVIDIIEEARAPEWVKDIREMNLGAYVVRTQDIWPALQALQSTKDEGEIQLTETIPLLINKELRVESYQIYDQDEIQGINTRGDLDRAEFILQKRNFRPKSEGDQNYIQFGTGGWRAVIGEGFTLYNVRRLCQALANDITRNGLEQKGVLIGYDRRFLSDSAAVAAAEVFAGNNIRAMLLNEDSPTPLIEYATDKVHAAYGLAFTASHNPPNWNGIKIFHGNGALLLTDETNQIEAEVNRLSLDDVVKVPLDISLKAGIVKRCDFTNEYVDRIESLIDMSTIRLKGLKVIVDPMYGVGHLTLGIILNDARCRVDFIHDRHNPLFGGRSPAPDLEALQMLSAFVRDGHYDIGLATDGDADRIAVVDERGIYLPINNLLLVLYWYLHEIKKLRGGIVRNLSTTHLLDRLAAAFGEKCIETPVGFKWISAKMLESDALLGGESSGGLAIRGHILGKDGIFASALIVEMLAKTGKRLSELQETVWSITGRLFLLEENMPATADMRIIVPQRFRGLISTGDIPSPIQKIREDDGIKIYFSGDEWALLRFSGTEPLLRLSAEANSMEKANRLIDWLKRCIA